MTYNNNNSNNQNQTKQQKINFEGEFTMETIFQNRTIKFVYNEAYERYELHNKTNQRICIRPKHKEEGITHPLIIGPKDWFYLFSDPKVDKDAYWLEPLVSGDVVITKGNKIKVHYLMCPKGVLKKKSNNNSSRRYPTAFHINKLFKEVCGMTYKEQKEKARELAVQWQYDFANNNYNWEEIGNFTDFFTKLGKRYGLLKEFRENGVI